MKRSALLCLPLLMLVSCKSGKKENAGLFESSEGVPLKYGERVEREKMALQIYRKDPRANLADMGLAYSGGTKSFSSLGNAATKEYSTKSNVPATIANQSFRGGNKVWVGSSEARMTGEYVGGKQRSREDNPANTLPGREYRSEVFDTRQAREAGARAYRTGQQQVYESQYAKPRTVEDDLIRNVYDKPYDIGDLKATLGR